MKIKITIYLFFVLMACSVFAQNINKGTNFFVKAISVINNSTLQIDWQLANPAQYDSVFIFQSLNYNSGYKKIVALSNTTLTSQTIVNNTFLYSPVYFFLEASKAGNSIKSDTVQPITLNVLDTRFQNYAGFDKYRITINWNHPFTSSPVPGSYIVYRKINDGNYTVIATLNHTTTQYQYEHTNCREDSVFHVVHFEPTLPHIPCISNNNKISLSALNTNKTSPFDSVSYIDDNTVQIVWLKGHELTQHYILYLNQKSGSIDNIPLSDPLSINDTVFAYQPAVTDTGRLIYFLNLTNNCGATTTYNSNTRRSTVFLYQPTYDICNKKIFLTWDTPLMPDVDSFYIYVSIWGGAWQKIAVLSSKILQYNYNMLPYNAQYKFMVQAKSTLRKKTSSSNRRNLNIVYSPFAENAFFYIPSYHDGKLIFKWAVQPLAQTSFVLEESCNQQNYFKISDFSISNQSIYFYNIYKDIYDKENCNYQLKLFDSCGNYLFSKQVAPIHLEIEEWDTYVNHLKWKIPVLSKMQIQKVTLLRMSKTGDNSINRQFEVANIYEGSFTDSVKPDYRHKGDFEYQLEVGYLDSIRWNPDTAMSNKVFAKINKEIFVPNAFTPGAATNAIFKPILVFVPEDGYYFVIFNRGGQKIFETNNPTEGWDGVDKFAGGPAPQGTYVYVIQYRNKTGKLVDKTGAVTLLR